MDERLIISREEVERLWPSYRGRSSRSLSNRLFGSLLAAYNRIDALEDDIAGLLALEHHAAEYLEGDR